MLHSPSIRIHTKFQRISRIAFFDLLKTNLAALLSSRWKRESITLNLQVPLQCPLNALIVLRKMAYVKISGFQSSHVTNVLRLRRASFYGYQGMVLGLVKFLQIHVPRTFKLFCTGLQELPSQTNGAIFCKPRRFRMFCMK